MIINDYSLKTKIKKGLKSVLTGSFLHKTDFKENFFANYKVDLYTVQIETINRCNGTCEFCPANKNVDTRKLAKMSEELFEKILLDLKQMNYTNRVALFSNNEPLLDTRVVDFAKKAREILPDAYIYMYTNGSLITEQIAKDLGECLSELVIDNYNDDFKLNENIKPIAELCKKDVKLDDVIRIHMRKEHEVLFTRGGQAPNNQKRVERDYPCWLPFNQMVIRPDGKVSLCCSDAMGTMTLGDVAQQTVKEVWEGEEYNKIRDMVVSDIAQIDLCKYCDSTHRR